MSMGLARLRDVLREPYHEVLDLSDRARERDRARVDLLDELRRDADPFIGASALTDQVREQRTLLLTAAVNVVDEVVNVWCEMRNLPQFEQSIESPTSLVLFSMVIADRTELADHSRRFHTPKSATGRHEQLSTG